MKLNPERAVEIPKQIILVQNFLFRISYHSGDIRERKREKSGNSEFAPSECIAFLGPQAELKKKLILRKSSLGLPLLESKRIFFLINNWPRY